jgi:hypothetical protein
MMPAAVKLREAISESSRLRAILKREFPAGVDEQRL